MAAGLPSVVVFLLCVTLVPAVSAREECKAYRDLTGVYHASQNCFNYCCGSCTSRYCCSWDLSRLTDDEQEDCHDSFPSFEADRTVTYVATFSTMFIVVLLLICCCVCPCCCLYKMCRKPQPVIATTTHTTVVSSTPQHYPQQPVMSPGQPQSYQGASYPGYQPVPNQPAYGPQPMPQAYGAQPMATAPYHGQPYAPGPPPPYQEAIGPCYPPAPMPYSQAAFSPGQPAYPLQPPAQPQANAPPAQPDYLAQPAYNPDYAPPPPKSGC